MKDNTSEMALYMVLKDKRLSSDQSSNFNGERLSSAVQQATPSPLYHFQNWFQPRLAFAARQLRISVSCENFPVNKQMKVCTRTPS
jgi:hypothetical protein